MSAHSKFATLRVKFAAEVARRRFGVRWHAAALDRGDMSP